MLPLLILNEIVWPAFALMSVAKPWRLELPASPFGVSQTVESVPCCWFSQGIGLTVQSTARAGIARKVVPTISPARSRPVARRLGKRPAARRSNANVLMELRGAPLSSRADIARIRSGLMLDTHLPVCKWAVTIGVRVVMELAGNLSQIG